MQELIHNDWWPVLKDAFEAPAYQQLRKFLMNEYQTQTVYPPAEDIFNAFRWTSYSQVKVVILGQDPYHGPGQAHGCSFSVRPGVPVPPSLKNIYQELATDVGAQPVNHGYLKSWADQGVLLLNAVLTVRAGQANSHRGMGWETITDAAIQALSQRPQPVVFILWGRSAQAKERLIDLNRNYVITSAHPSPLSAYRGFFGSKPFSRANLALNSWGVELIDWQLPMNVTE